MTLTFWVTILFKDKEEEFKNLIHPISTVQFLTPLSKNICPHIQLLQEFCFLVCTRKLKKKIWKGIYKIIKNVKYLSLSIHFLHRESTSLKVTGVKRVWGKSGYITTEKKKELREDDTPSSQEKTLPTSESSSSAPHPPPFKVSSPLPVQVTFTPTYPLPVQVTFTPTYPLPVQVTFTLTYPLPVQVTFTPTSPLPVQVR